MTALPASTVVVPPASTAPAASQVRYVASTPSIVGTFMTASGTVVTVTGGTTGARGTTPAVSTERYDDRAVGRYVVITI